MGDDREKLQTVVAGIHKNLSNRYLYFEIILVDNGRYLALQGITTSLLADYSSLRIVKLFSRVDRDTALICGLGKTIGDHVVVAESDFDSYSAVADVLKSLESGDALVLGEDQNSGGKWSRALSRMASIALGAEHTVTASRLSGFQRDIVLILTRFKSKRKNLFYFAERSGHRPVRLSYIRTQARPHRLDLLRQALTLALSFSIRPLRVTSVICVGCSCLSLTYLLYALAVAVLKQRIAEGWLTTSVMISTLFLFMFVILSMIAEYIGRILDETTDVPSVFVQQDQISLRMSTNVLNIERDKGNHEQRTDRV